MTAAPPASSSDCGHDPLQPVSLPDLVRSGGRRCWRVAQTLKGLHQAREVEGNLVLRHLGDSIDLQATVHTHLQLCCDRCLQPFSQPLAAEVQDRIPFHAPLDSLASPIEALSTLQEALTTLPDPISSPEDPLSPLDEPLDPCGSFDPEHWLFEQLSLRLPLVNRCGPACPGPATWSSQPPTPDPRWAALASLQAQEPPQEG